MSPIFLKKKCENFDRAPLISVVILYGLSYCNLIALFVYYLIVQSYAYVAAVKQVILYNEYI